MTREDSQSVRRSKHSTTLKRVTRRARDNAQFVPVTVVPSSATEIVAEVVLTGGRAVRVSRGSNFADTQQIQWRKVFY